jgi:hypothetical protein
MKILKTFRAFFIFLLAPVLLFAEVGKLEEVWGILLRDLLQKYSVSESIEVLCPNVEACMVETQEWPLDEKLQLKVEDILIKLRTRFHPNAEAFETREVHIRAVLKWLRSKYGIVADAPLVLKMDAKTAGSYASPGRVSFRIARVEKPLLFNRRARTSLSNLEAYLKRKWGGLHHYAKPDRILFSKLGTRDTLEALQGEGFEEFYLINGPYARRGSKTLLAFSPDSSDPVVVFHSFVSENLLQHKVMQLAYYYPPLDFQKIRVLDSNNLKSWEVADIVVGQALRSLSAPVIDDLVIGYTDRVKGELITKGAEDLGAVRLGRHPEDFATVRIFKVKGHNITRTVAILEDVDFRYFGKSALALIRPFLNRGIDRVIFAGSTGVLDPRVKIHSLIIPRGFFVLNPRGAVGERINIDNDLFGLLPLGHSYSGPHLSVPSPLVETQARVKRLRESGFFSVDGEASEIAELIADFNGRNMDRRPVRLAVALVATDHPRVEGDPQKEDAGLHRPDYRQKRRAKENYVAGLDLLWEIPDARLKPSNHTRIIAAYYAQQIERFKEHPIQLASLYAEIEARLQTALGFLKDDLRVSHGIIKTYRDLLRTLDLMGIEPIDPQAFHEKLELPILPKRSPKVERLIVLESLTRSSTLNSGETGAKGADSIGTRRMAIEGVSKAVDFIFENRRRALKKADLEKIHELANQGEARGFRSFDYHPWDRPAKASIEYLREFCEWLERTEPSSEVALEAFLRFEHLHLGEDGNGRTAELLLQHFMLRSGQHPLLLPNRFDIDYILSLRRNGSFPYSIQTYLKASLERSLAFSDWLKANLKLSEVEASEIDPETGFVKVSLHSGEALHLPAIFKLGQRLHFEREARAIVERDQGYDVLVRPGTSNANVTSALHLPYTQFTKSYGLVRSSGVVGCQDVLSALAAHLDAQGS